MKILLLGSHAMGLSSYLDGHDLLISVDPLQESLVKLWQLDWIISFGYRHILTPNMLEAVNGQALNVHISLLPWNRGSDPNFWSWIENTPKGVTVHRMNEDIDRGRVIYQEEVTFDSPETLRSSYEKLIKTSIDVFTQAWKQIESGELSGTEQVGRGSYHRSSDLNALRHLLVDGWDTPCEFLSEHGRKNGLWITT